MRTIGHRRSGSDCLRRTKKPPTSTSQTYETMHARTSHVNECCARRPPPAAVCAKPVPTLTLVLLGMLTTAETYAAISGTALRTAWLFVTRSKTASRAFEDREPAPRKRRAVNCSPVSSSASPQRQHLRLVRAIRPHLQARRPVRRDALARREPETIAHRARSGPLGSTRARPGRTRPPPPQIDTRGATIAIRRGLVTRGRGPPAPTLRLRGAGAGARCSPRRGGRPRRGRRSSS
jgi:hypothetical protein